jgi:hypothetical protein
MNKNLALMTTWDQTFILSTTFLQPPVHHSNYSNNLVTTSNTSCSFLFCASLTSFTKMKHCGKWTIIKILHSKMYQSGYPWNRKLVSKFHSWNTNKVYLPWSVNKLCYLTSPLLTYLLNYMAHEITYFFKSQLFKFIFWFFRII